MTISLIERAARALLLTQGRCNSGKALAFKPLLRDHYVNLRTLSIH
jgi:hypothetical protein